MEIKQKGIEIVFLTYANNSFRDSPENLRKVSDKIVSHFFSPYLENTYGDISSSHLRDVVKGIISALKRDDSTEITNIYFGKCEKRYLQKYSEIIKEAITQRSYTFCKDECLLKKYREPLFRAEIFCNTKEIKCYEY